MKRIIFSLLLMFSFSSASFAWDVPARALDLKESLSSTSDASGEDDVVLIPTASLGFGVGSPTVSYGYSGAYDIVFGHVSSGSKVGVDSLSPYFGIGASLYIDLGNWIDSGLQQPVLADGGINVLGPQIQGLVPTFQIIWNFQTGEEKRIVGFTAPFSIFDNLIIKLF